MMEFKLLTILMSIFCCASAKYSNFYRQNNNPGKYGYKFDDDRNDAQNGPYNKGYTIGNKNAPNAKEYKTETQDDRYVNGYESGTQNKANPKEYTSAYKSDQYNNGHVDGTANYKYETGNQNDRYHKENVDGTTQNDEYVSETQNTKHHKADGTKNNYQLKQSKSGSQNDLYLISYLNRCKDNSEERITCQNDEAEDTNIDEDEADYSMELEELSKFRHLLLEGGKLDYFHLSNHMSEDQDYPRFPQGENDVSHDYIEKMESNEDTHDMSNSDISKDINDVIKGSDVIDQSMNGVTQGSSISSMSEKQDGEFKGSNTVSQNQNVTKQISTKKPQNQSAAFKSKVDIVESQTDTVQTKIDMSNGNESVTHESKDFVIGKSYATIGNNDISNGKSRINLDKNGMTDVKNDADQDTNHSSQGKTENTNGTDKSDKAMSRENEEKSKDSMNNTMGKQEKNEQQKINDDQLNRRSMYFNRFDGIGRHHNERRYGKVAQNNVRNRDHHRYI